MKLTKKNSALQFTPRRENSRAAISEHVSYTFLNRFSTWTDTARRLLSGVFKDHLRSRHGSGYEVSRALAYGGGL